MSWNQEAVRLVIRDFAFYFEIWRMGEQHHCLSCSKIEEQLDFFKYQYNGSEISRDLSIRRFVGVL